MLGGRQRWQRVDDASRHRFWSLEISSRSSCRSSSLIFSAKDGISVFASSAFSQQREPVRGSASLVGCGRSKRRVGTGEKLRTELCSLKFCEVLVRAQ